MFCKVCGDEQATYRERSRLWLCDSCHKDTPAKVNRETFERLFWGEEIATVPSSTQASFWEDYKLSECGSVDDYIKETSN